MMMTKKRKQPLPSSSSSSSSNSGHHRAIARNSNEMQRNNNNKALEFSFFTPTTTSSASLSSVVSLSTRSTTCNMDTRKPYQLRFPPTIYTNVMYSQGIQLAEPVEIPLQDNNDDNDSAATATATTITARVRDNYYYKKSHHQSDDLMMTPQDKKRKISIASFFPRTHPHAIAAAPILTPSEALLWCTKKAGESMSKSYFPVQTARLIGTITRHVRISVKQQQQRQQQQNATSNKAGNTNSAHAMMSVQPPFVADTRTTASIARQKINPKLKGAKLYPLSAAQAKKEAQALLLHSTKDTETTEPAVAAVAQLAQQLQDTWMDRVLLPGQQPSPTCSVDDGYYLLPEAVNDPTYVPLPFLQKWLMTDYYDWTQVVSTVDDCDDVDSTATTTTRGSNSNVISVHDSNNNNNHNDLESILHALTELSTPHAVSYDLPMIICYPTVRRRLFNNNNNKNVDDDDNNNNSSSSSLFSDNNNNSTLERSAKRRKLQQQQDVKDNNHDHDDNNRDSNNDNDIWEIQMAVYAHRSLPLILTESSVKTVMSALDIGSFRITEPLHLPPRPSQPTFASCKFPFVTFDDDDDDEIEEHSGDGDGDDDDNIKNNSNNKDVVDLTLQGMTRDENTVSAFSTAGLMKLLENTGTDTSHWPEIAQKLQSSLTLELMLHQQHAVCWMVQMEQLEGFGINSILWEEREFLDGGKFYYSPALGQIQLNRPATMKGGILCDQMGMGKTIELLALVIATMDEVKAKAKKRSEQSNGIFYSHTTLIVVPPALANQWMAEIDKASKHFAKPLTARLLLHHKELCSFVEGEERAFAAGDDEFLADEPDIIVTTYRAVEKAQPRFLVCYGFGRVVLDEMQEIRSSTTKIARNCDKILSQRRWMISGTPLFEGVSDLRGELNFLSVEGFAAKSEDGFFEHAIMNHWAHHSRHAIDILLTLGTLMLRRTKDMRVLATNEPLMALPPFTIDFVPVPQSSSERALYCFLESLVAKELKNLGSGSKKDGSSRKLCLRLLRELCISPVLLNGGMGVQSQLKLIDNLMVRENRRSLGTDGTASTGGALPTATIFSCSEAIRYLSVAQRGALLHEDFVTDLVVGAGGGISNRARAMETLEERLADSRKGLADATKLVKENQSIRAKANWKLLLERVTCGSFEINFNVDSNSVTNMNRKVRALWRWRFVFANLKKVFRQTNLNHHGNNTVFHRGWRPAKDFLRNIAMSHPDFIWAHKTSLKISRIPPELRAKDIMSSFYYNDFSYREYRHGALPWTLIFKFNDTSNYAKILSASKSLDGIVIPASTGIPSVAHATQKAKESMEDAKAEHSVHATATSKSKLEKAKRRFAEVSIGMRILFSIPEDTYFPTLQISPATGPLRSASPGRCSVLYSVLKEAIDAASGRIAVGQIDLKKWRKQLQMYEHAETIKVSDEVKSLSAFEYLQALMSKNYDSTFCAICLCPLGSSADKPAGSMPGMIALTTCCHLFCKTCLDHHFDTNGAGTQCPFCRKNLSRQDVRFVDPSLTHDIEEMERQVRDAKEVIRQASKLLETSNGVLEAEMWEKLYLSFDLPAGVCTSADRRLGAIPNRVLQHFRAATLLPTHSKPSTRYPVNDDGTPSIHMSSKIARLIADLPTDERSVVFTSSVTSVKHLLVCLDAMGPKYQYQALFAGQNDEAQEVALDVWKNEDLSHPILAVQSGTAASGLTLTAACKMFFLEPFVRQEEENQAYARCHRFGQTRPVQVKCYYTPVSVESRMLEWRKRAPSEGLPTDAAITYEEEKKEDDEDEVSSESSYTEKPLLEAEIDEEGDQITFLLQEHLLEAGE